ncbi:isocitrate lyase/phosphoenolpyruvate mutase family protein [Streptomyces profundus]|uniref:isocitrate lyase/phosphoenolpyruvate mutase family protein n=1 Tax=Streptomyces profundus TaxID=2867410 RepID=UPI001D165B0A|nr:isocitrate lyase/phosphoenolpyruvate mutase family protein [Streptomyces sp. MA3_2.13]UED88007.1 isocitrate lyase/phosphoenolpyruvate mutase family protein [Streptomyces sp. MA3_2.13]
MSLRFPSEPHQDKARIFRQRLLSGRLQRAVGVHDGFTALLAGRHSYDALWVSGLGISAAHGLPDAGILSMADFLAAARIADRASRLPVIADCDSGFGDVNNIVHLVREYEAAGIAAVCVEDKNFPKRNSFSDGQELADPHEFATKILAAKKAQRTADFTVIARVESLVAGASLDDALYRADLYTAAGADAVVIHSKSKTADEVLAFAHRFHPKHPDVPLIVIPTTYPLVSEEELAAAGVSVTIYANQMLRAFVTAADDVLARIATDRTAGGADTQLIDVRQILDLIGTGAVSENSTWFDETAELSRAATART